MTDKTNTETAARLREQAAQHDRNAAESFERCDTDGFLSQWASGINAEVARRNADIAEAGGVWTFERTRLTDLDGNIVEDARAVDTRYGRKWRVDSADAWLPYMPARESTLGKRGYREVVETAVAPAKAITSAPRGARGLSGATSVSVVIIRTDAQRSDGWRPIGAPTE
jgi:hypothetical protein